MNFVHTASSKHWFWKIRQPYIKNDAVVSIGISSMLPDWRFKNKAVQDHLSKFSPQPFLLWKIIVSRNLIATERLAARRCLRTRHTLRPSFQFTAFERWDFLLPLPRWADMGEVGNLCQLIRVGSWAVLIPVQLSASVTFEGAFYALPKNTSGCVRRADGLFWNVGMDHVVQIGWNIVWTTISNFEEEKWRSLERTHGTCLLCLTLLYCMAQSLMGQDRSCNKG